MLGKLTDLISRLYKYGYPSNSSCNNVCDICKIERMVIKLIPLGYVKNYDINRYLENFSKAAVHKPFIKYQHFCRYCGENTRIKSHYSVDNS